MVTDNCHINEGKKEQRKDTKFTHLSLTNQPELNQTTEKEWKRHLFTKRMDGLLFDGARNVGVGQIGRLFHAYILHWSHICETLLYGRVLEHSRN